MHNSIDFTALGAKVKFSQIMSWVSHYSIPEMSLMMGWAPYAAVAGMLMWSGLFFVLPTSTARMIISLITVAVVLAGMIWYVCRRAIGITRQTLRYQQFAADNDFEYTPFTSVYRDDARYTGLLFSAGSSNQTILHRFVTRSSVPVEIGNFQYGNRLGRDVMIPRYAGYICLDLQHFLPHMVLDARRNNIRLLSKTLPDTLMLGIDRNQTLRLEGDFNDYFTLYAPRDYERDALYIFAPDLMALLIDETQQFDAEIIDSKLYFYGKSFDFGDSRVWQRIQAIVNVMEPKLLRQTYRYSDSHAVLSATPAGQVAEQGRRLKKHSLVWVFIAAWAILWLVSVLTRS